MNNIDKAYTDLLQDILENGIEKNTRNGKVLSVFGRSIRYNFKDGKFPLLTTKKMAFKTMVTELLWFLRGDTSIEYLLKNDCNIWTGDAYKNYVNKCNEDKCMKEIVLGLPFPNKSYGLFSQEEFINKIKTDNEFAKQWGSLGKIYGKQWRKWEKCELTNDDDFGDDTSWGDWNIKQIDQIANLISDLKTNPDSRRLLVSAWNPADLDSCVLPPCHYGFQVYTRELSSQERKDLYDKSNYSKDIFPTDENRWNQLFDGYSIPTRAISLSWNQRSVDTGLGLSFNIASYALLLMMIAKQVNMVPDELIGNLGDVHLYLNHIDPIQEQLTREPYELPTVKISDRVVNDISEYTLDDIILENYQSHPVIKMPLSN